MNVHTTKRMISGMKDKRPNFGKPHQSVSTGDEAGTAQLLCDAAGKPASMHTHAGHTTQLYKYMNNVISTRNTSRGVAVSCTFALSMMLRANMDYAIYM